LQAPRNWEKCSASANTVSIEASFVVKGRFLMMSHLNGSTWKNSNLMYPKNYLSHTIQSSGQGRPGIAYFCSGPWQCALFLIPRSFHDGGALNYSTAPHRSKTTLISNGVFCLLESKILSIGQTLLYSLAFVDSCLHW
jgi:hypothetical protein